MQFHYEQLRVPDVPFIVMEDVVFSDGQLWTVFHDRNAMRFWMAKAIMSVSTMLRRSRLPKKSTRWSIRPDVVARVDGAIVGL